MKTSLIVALLFSMLTVSISCSGVNDPDTLDYDSIAKIVFRISKVLKSVSFGSLDLHYYDDYWNWPLYLESIKLLMSEAGMDPGDYVYVASEFGGPHPELEADDESFKAE